MRFVLIVSFVMLVSGCESAYYGVNEKFGIRVTDVISPSERIKKLK